MELKHELARVERDGGGGGGAEQEKGQERIAINGPLTTCKGKVHESFKVTQTQMLW